MVLCFTQCKPTPEGGDENRRKVKVSCIIPINKGDKSDFANLMEDGSINWSTGTERVYLTIPNETNPQIVELTAFTTMQASELAFEGEVEEGLLEEGGEYEVWYLGNSKETGTSYIEETKDGDVITKVSGNIAEQSGSLTDLGLYHIAKATVTAVEEDGEIVLPLRGTLKNQIAIAYLDLEGVEELRGAAIKGTEYSLQYNEGTNKFDFVVAENSSKTINVTAGTAKSFVVLLPNEKNNVVLKSSKGGYEFKKGVDGNKLYYRYISNVEKGTLRWEEIEENEINGHEYVDLGLPSGLLWATCNVGAETPEEYGNYYAWGETAPDPNNNYSSSNCSTYGLSYSSLQSQGYIDSNGNLTAQYDAATANWGGDWRMPTKVEYNELLNHCAWTWTTQNGVNGYKVKGPNGNSIFLPAAGGRLGSSLYDAGSLGYYWSSSEYGSTSYLAYYLDFDSSNLGMYNIYRYYGRSVRPVSGGNNAEPEEPEEPETPNSNNHEYVDLGLPSGLLWATCNVGAETPEEYGNYYAWGETTTKSTYSSSNSATYGLTNSQLQSQGYIDSEINLTAQHDAAAVNWGGDWRMPTYEEQKELLNNCTWTWTTHNGVSGYKVTSKVNSNYIFLPAAGYRYGSLLYNAGSNGYYWSSNPIGSDSGSAHRLYFSSSFQRMIYDGRYYGQSVRPVLE